MKKFKTAEKNRENYVYYTADEKRIVIVSDDVDSKWIEFLHNNDDSEVDAERRENYHVPVHYDSYVDGNGTEAEDHNSYMEDTDSDPLQKIIASINKKEHEELLDKLESAIKTLQENQITLIRKVYFEKMSNVDIAAEEGVTEAAIRNRLKKIHKKLLKKFQIRGFDYI